MKKIVYITPQCEAEDIDIDELLQMVIVSGGNPLEGGEGDDDDDIGDSRKRHTDVWDDED